jgi:hypothetical protein
LVRTKFNQNSAKKTTGKGQVAFAKKSIRHGGFKVGIPLPAEKEFSTV